jgi:hypothetical protein
MVPGIGISRGNLGQAIEDLGSLLMNSQAMVMKTAEKLLQVGVQQAVQDASRGSRIDVTA